jgi:hypothetical protein
MLQMGTKMRLDTNAREKGFRLFLRVYLPTSLFQENTRKLRTHQDITIASFIICWGGFPVFTDLLTTK